MRVKYCLPLAVASLLAGPAFAGDACPSPVEIVAGAPAAQAGSGRLLLFAQKAAPGAPPPTALHADPFEPKIFAAAREVAGLTAGASLRFYPGDIAYPAPIDQLAPGDYWVQALLDRDHSYGYSGRGPGDVVSKVMRVSFPCGSVQLELDTVSPAAASQWEYPGMKRPWAPGERELVEARIKPFALDSGALQAFAGRPVQLKGYVLTPPGYDGSDKRYPVVYFTHGFQAGMTALADSAIGVLRQTVAGSLPPMIWVFLDQSSPTGTHEFADSVNNGPWGTALTRELLPEIDRRYRTDPQAGRYVIGHSSGGWAALWLQVAYPKLFRGAWATSPDYVDFTSYAGLDLTDPKAVHGALENARMEEVLGEYGGQEQSFEWVFSPRGADGRPLRLYDRRTGAIDRAVADYWIANWDISRRVRTRWPQLKDDLDGKIHIVVGANDEFKLDVSVRRFDAVLKSLGAHASIDYLPGKGHFNLYAEGTERQALRRRIGWQIWKAAYPSSSLKDPGPPPQN